MRYWQRLVCAISLGALVHCSSASAPSDEPTGAPGVGGRDSDAGASSRADASTAPNEDNAQAAAADGVVVAHASDNMPAFRLCFGNSGVAGNLLPLPDQELMPQSNVVGVDVGSAVRLRPFAEVGITLANNGGTPHTVYAIPEKYLRPPQRPANTPCSALICPGLGGDCLDAGQFFTLGKLPDGAYGPGMHLLAVDGCVPGSGDVTSCGADFNVTSGNAKIADVDLQAYTHKQKDDFVVQIAQLSAPLASGAVGATFGALGANGTSIKVTSTLNAISPATPTRLSFSRTDPQVYAKQGFHLEVGGLSLDQSLAQIQALSAPDALPADFYATSSNFVLLLLGNPADTSASGAPKSATTDPGKVVHLLAVPVATTPAADGGVDAGPYDAGTRSDAALDGGGKG
jgi:hypothetical protein